MCFLLFYTFKIILNALCCLSKTRPWRHNIIQYTQQRFNHLWLQSVTIFDKRCLSIASLGNVPNQFSWTTVSHSKGKHSVKKKEENYQNEQFKNNQIICDGQVKINILTFITEKNNSIRLFYVSYFSLSYINNRHYHHVIYLVFFCFLTNWTSSGTL